MTQSKPPARTPPHDSLTVEIGHWFKANATGRGVFVIGLVLVLVAAAGITQVWLSAAP